MKLALVLCAILVALCGCRHGPLRSRRAASEAARVAKQEPRLTEAEVLRITDEYAAEKFGPFGGIDLDNYPGRRAVYDAVAELWSVLYHREPNRWPGDHFTIVVDDAGKHIEYHGGK